MHFNFREVVIIFLFVFVSAFAYSQKEQWLPLGPHAVPLNQGGGNASGIGRVTCLRFHPAYDGITNNNFFLGTPDGGLWKSSSGGNDWKCLNTDKLPVLGVSDVAINPVNPSEIYIASGDPDALFNQYAPCGGNQSSSSRGIFKSVDGGISWNTSALGIWHDQNKKLLKGFWNYPSYKIIQKLKYFPGKPNTLITVLYSFHANPASYDSYIFQSKDGGQNWYTLLYVPDGYLHDLEFMPGNPRVIYASGRNVFKSDNGGKKWKKISSFTDTLGNVSRIELAVTKAEAKYVYADVSPAGIIYKSADAGKTFEAVLKGFQNGNDNRMAMAVSPKEKEAVFFNYGIYVNYFFANDLKRKRMYSINNTHPDIHDLTFAPDSDLLFISTDGCIYKSAKTDSVKWNTTDISNGLEVAKIHRIGVSQHSDKLIAGAQDVGTLLYDTSFYAPNNWATITGGDGAECFIDFTNDSIIYRSDGQGYSSVTRSEDNGKKWSGNLLPRDSAFGGVVKPFVISASNHNTLYFGFKDIIKNTNRGNGKWEKISRFGFDFPGENQFIADFRVAETDSNIIYCAFPNPVWGNDDKEKQRLFKTTDEGKTWRDITKELKGVDWSSLNCIAVHPSYPDIVLTGFTGCAHFKIMISFDGGMNWKDFSEELPAECDVNSIVIDKTSATMSMFAGTLKGVYHRDDLTGKWISFNNGLPNSKINELEINYFNHSLYAATEGRGVWIVKLE